MFNLKNLGLDVDLDNNWDFSWVAKTEDILTPPVQLPPEVWHDEKKLPFNPTKSWDAIVALSRGEPG